MGRNPGNIRGAAQWLGCRPSAAQAPRRSPRPASFRVPWIRGHGGGAAGGPHLHGQRGPPLLSPAHSSAPSAAPSSTPRCRPPRGTRSARAPLGRSAPALPRSVYRHRKLSDGVTELAAFPPARERVTRAAGVSPRSLNIRARLPFHGPTSQPASPTSPGSSSPPPSGPTGGRKGSDRRRPSPWVDGSRRHGGDLQEAERKK